jgi:galactonate dehydratase
MRIRGMDVYAVHVNHRGDWVFVVLRTDSGLTGLGEASHSGPNADARMPALLLEQCFPTLRGQDPRAPQPLVAALRSLVIDRVTATAMSACEQALWDLAGKAAGVPTSRLLGAAQPRPLPLYANINRATVDRSPAGFAATAGAAAAEGFGAVKLAPFDGMAPGAAGTPGGDALVEQGLACIAAVRRALPPTVEVLVDCHSRFDLATALRVAARLRELGVTWFEEPVPTMDLPALRQVRAAVPDLRLIGGEALFGLEAFRPYLEARLWDVAMPDVKHCGGIAALLEIASLAAEHGVTVSPHNPSGPVATAASAQALLLLPAAGRLEYAWGEAPWRAALVQPPERIEHGQLLVNDGPGLGVELDLGVLRQHLAGAWSR